MGLNLNLDSFRAMVGQSNYGDVRLGSTGTLEKVNNHFLQRKFGLFETTVSPAENQQIRKLFLNALQEAGVSREMYKQIRDDLGLGAGGDNTKALSRRTIVAVLEKFDADQLEQKNGKDNPLVQRFGAMKFADFKQVIQNWNAAPGAEPIALSDDKLEVFFNRHGGQFKQKLAKITSTSLEPKELDREIARHVREFLLDSIELGTLEAGEKAFTRGKDHVSESRREALSEVDAITRAEAKRQAETEEIHKQGLKLRNNFTPSTIEKICKNSKLVPILDSATGAEVFKARALSNKDVEFTKDDFLMIPLNKERLESATKDLALTLNKMAETIANDNSRNPMNVYFNKKIYMFKFVGEAKTDESRANRNWNVATAKAFVNDFQAFLVKEKGEAFSLGQFLSACMAPGQGNSRLSGNVYGAYEKGTDCSITFDGDKFTATYTQELQFKGGTEKKNYGLSVEYNQDGTAQPTYLKPVHTPRPDPTTQDPNEFSIYEPPEDLISQPSKDSIPKPPEVASGVRS